MGPFDEFDRMFRDMQRMMNTQSSGARGEISQQVRLKHEGFIVDRKNNKIYLTIDAHLIKGKDDIFLEVLKDKVKFKFVIDGERWPKEGSAEVVFPVLVKPKTTKSKFVELTGVLDIEVDIEDTP